MSDSVSDSNRDARAIYTAMLATWEWYLAGLRALHPRVPERALRLALRLMLDAAERDPIKGGAMLAELVQAFRAAGFTERKPFCPKAETVSRLEQELRVFARRPGRTSRQ